MRGDWSLNEPSSSDQARDINDAGGEILGTRRKPGPQHRRWLGTVPGMMGMMDGVTRGVRRRAFGRRRSCCWQGAAALGLQQDWRGAACSPT